MDLPTVRNIVLLRPVGSMSMFKQMIGRGSRLFPDQDKHSFDIIDYSGATALFEDPEFNGPPERGDDEGTIVSDAVVEEPEPDFEPGDAEDSIDPIDLLVHFSWNQPLATRTDRARRVGKEHADVFDAYRPEPRDVLNGLLAKFGELIDAAYNSTGTLVVRMRFVANYSCDIVLTHAR